jgi:hypothetical protein
MKMLGMKMKNPVGPTAAVTRDDAEAAAARDDKLAKRRGGAADILTGGGPTGGVAGVEAGATGKTVLG